MAPARRAAYADALMLTGGTLFALDLVLALANALGWADPASAWLGAFALASSSLAFASMWIARYRGFGTQPPSPRREPTSG